MRGVYRLVVLGVLWLGGLHAGALDLYVATDGRDDWSGLLAAPSEAGDDGPFATLERALAAARAERGGERVWPVTIHVRGGRYALAQPIVLTPEDSGSADQPLVIRAYGDERPIFSGGTRLAGWRVGEDGAWRVTLPEGVPHFSQLFVDDQRRFRPRVPASGYLRMHGQPEPSDAAGGRGHDRMGYHEGDLDPAWANRDDVEVLAIHIWSASRMRIAGFDTEHHTVTFTGPTRTTARWAAFLDGHRYLAINVKEALGRPGVVGEWYLDRPTRELTYIPVPGETPGGTAVVAPRLETLLRFEGDLAGGRYVEHIEIEGLTFAHAAWSLPAEGQSFPQAEVHLPGAVRALASRFVTLRGCAVRHVGGYGVEVGPGCRDFVIDRCELMDLGAGGIKIGKAGGAQSWAIHGADFNGPEAEVQRVTVADSHITHGGRLHPAAIGVWVGHASYCTVLHNHIADFYYSGVSVGWTWGYKTPSDAHHNRVAYNVIETIGQGVLSDMAGIYTLGVSPGTSVDHNIIRDVNAYDYGGWGLYTDEGSTGIAMTHNLVVRTKTGGFHQHYGRENRIAHNVFVDAQTHQLQRTRVEGHRSFTFDHNIVYWTHPSPLLGSNWQDDGFAMADNLYWNPGHAVQFAGGLSLERWQAERGQDHGSAVGDPLFVDVAGGDFALREDSPALRMGFEAWDYVEAGPRYERRMTLGLPGPPAGFESPRKADP